MGQVDGAVTAMAACICLLGVVWHRNRTDRALRVAALIQARSGEGAVGPRRNGKSARGRSVPLRLVGNAMVAELCMEVSARLRAGDPSEQAWQRSLVRMLGVEAALESALTEAGQSGRVVLQAIRFSELTGAPQAEVLERCADALTESERVADARRVAFAGPRMSASVLTALPLVGLLGAQMLGTDPLGWFFGGAGQLLVLALGVGFGVAGRVVSTRLVKGAERVGQLSDMAPVLCDLAVSGLRSGQSVPAVLSALGKSGLEHGDDGAVAPLERISAELLLGASWEEAWTPVPAVGTLLYRALEPAWTDGISPIRMLSGVAESARARSVTGAKEAAEKLGIKLAMPLGLLLLPSFVILGLLPIFFSLVGRQLGGLFG